jgi:DNA-binding transcriptional LysR family regulator
VFFEMACFKIVVSKVMNIDTLDWDRLRVFRVVAELGSMNAAATRLGESTPTISRKIDELERSLGGVELLVRSTRGVTLTDAGKLALRHAESMADAADALRNDVQAHEPKAEGAITLVTGDGVGAHWIAPRIPDFQRQNPGIRLQLIISDEPNDLHHEEADICVQFQEPQRPDLIVRRLGVLHYMAFASRDYLNENGVPGSLFDFRHHRCIFHTGYVKQIERWAPKTAEFRRMMAFALVTNSGAVMLNACANGSGIAIAPSYAVDIDSRLVPLNIGEMAPIQFWVTYSERTRRLPQGQVVVDWIRQIFDPRQVEWFRDKFEHPKQVIDQRRASAEQTASADLQR